MKVSASTIALIGVKLFVICAVSAILLSMLNAVTRPRIEKNRIEQQKAALGILAASGDIGDKQEIDDDTVTAVFPVAEGGALSGYILELMGSGYGDLMTLLAFYKPDGELRSAKLMENKETPGLGKKAESDEYMKKFIGRGGTGGRSIPTAAALLKEQTGSSGTAADSGVVITSINDFFQFVFEWFFGKPKTGGSDSVSGATITFQGVSRALAAGSDYIKENLGGGK